MADDNSQDYQGYDRAVKGELYETPQKSPYKGMGPDVSGTDIDKDSDTEESDGESAGESASGGDDTAAGQGSAVKDPQDWTTGDEPATPAQMSYISTMAVEAKEEVPVELTKAEASEKIHELQQKTGRDDSTERP